MDLILTILPVVTKDLPISPRFTPYNFLSRCKFSTLTTRQPMVEFYLLTIPRFPLRKKEHKSDFGKNRTHDFRTSTCAAYLLDHPTTIELHLQNLFIADSASTGCNARFCCQCKGETDSDESNDESYFSSPGIGLSFAMCHPPLSQETDGSQLLVDLGSSNHFIDPELIIRGVESRMLGDKTK